MKLSEKGYLKIGNSIAGWVENGILKVTFDPNKIDFEPDDFKNGVVLTVEEAKEIAFKLKELSEGYFLETGNIDSRSIEWLIVLDERIEQAEKQDE